MCTIENFLQKLCNNNFLIQKTSRVRAIFFFLGRGGYANTGLFWASRIGGGGPSDLVIAAKLGTAPQKLCKEKDFGVVFLKNNTSEVF